MGVNINSDIYVNDNIVIEDNIFKDKKVVITGSFSLGSRDVLKKKLEGLGAKVVSSITKNTDYLLCGDKPGSKLEKAKEIGVKVIEESDEVFRLLY